MGEFKDLAAQFDRTNAKRKGDQFEIVCKWFLENDPIYKSLFTRVWLWSEWPRRWPVEAGIDIVAEDRDKNLWAIQCKAEADHVTHDGVAHFIAEASRPEFSNLMLIATTDRVHFIGERTMKETAKPVTIVRLSDLEAAEVDWPSSLADLHPAPPKAPKKPWPYQQDAINDVVGGFKGADRGQLIMACGTGKTLTSLFIKEECGANRTLVLLPSLSLLRQTLREWMANRTADFEFLAVCSDDSVSKADRYDAALLHTSNLGVPSVTDPQKIASFLRKQSPRVVFATYQSSPQIQEAFKLGHVPAFDLAIADEAHRCTGRVGTDFTTILDTHAIRADKRLFMTATPRRFTKRIRTIAEANDFEVASMDDEARFGCVFHRLGFAEAIEKDRLTDYQVLVVGVDDDTYRSWAKNGRFVTRDGKQIENARDLAGQIGLAKAMKKYDLRRAISFHNRIEDAREFATEMPQVVAWMPPDQRPTGKIVSEHVSGSLSAEKRHIVLQRLAHIEDDERGLVTNARCLSEGIDVPALDCVAFIDPRRSEVDIVQAVGRAIRRSGDKKLGTIVIPVFIDIDEDPEIALENSDFDAVWDVVKALRAHDDELGRQLDELRWELGRRGGRLRIPQKIKLLLPAKVGGQFVSAFETHLVVETTTSWQFWYGLLQRFISEHGHGRVAALYKTSDGYTLGRWVNKQRTAYQDGRLPAERVRLLEALGPTWSWDARGDRWEQGFAKFMAYVDENDSALVPDNYKSPDGFALGKWLGNQRTQFTKNKVSAEHIARLEASHPTWSWNTKVGMWQEAFDHLTDFVAEKGHARVPQGYKTSTGYPLGSWVMLQRGKFNKGQLERDLQTRLENVHPTWSWDVRTDYREEGFAALEEFIRQHGHARVPAGYRTTGEFSLGHWVSYQRQCYRKGLLDNDIQRRLEKSDPSWSWDPNTDKWEEGFDRFCDFVRQNGHARVPSAYRCGDGYRLGAWAAVQRQAYRLGRLDPVRIKRLENYHPTWVWNALSVQWGEGFEHLSAYAEEFGHSRPPQNYRSPDGYRLGGWVSKQRQDFRSGKISDDRIKKLISLPGWEWDRRKNQP